MYVLICGLLSFYLQICRLDFISDHIVFKSNSTKTGNAFYHTSYSRNVIQISLANIVFFFHQIFIQFELRPKRENGENLYVSSTYVIPNGGEGSSYGWSEWSGPSSCSRTCGGGVSYQTRECHDVEYV